MLPEALRPCTVYIYLSYIAKLEQWGGEGGKGEWRGQGRIQALKKRGGGQGRYCARRACAKFFGPHPQTINDGECFGLREQVYAVVYSVN